MNLSLLFLIIGILALPMLSSIVSAFFGRKVGISGQELITCLSVIIIAHMATIGFHEIGLYNISVSVLLFRWVDLESSNVQWKQRTPRCIPSFYTHIFITSNCIARPQLFGSLPLHSGFFKYFTLRSTLINVLQTPKVRHFATLTDLPSNYNKPFNIIEIYLTKHEYTDTDLFFRALEKVLIYDQYYSCVIGILKHNDRSTHYVWREFCLHFHYSQIPIFASIIMDNIDIVNKNLLEVDVVLYLWPCAPGGVPYPKGPRGVDVIKTHILRYKWFSN